MINLSKLLLAFFVLAGCSSNNDLEKAQHYFVKGDYGSSLEAYKSVIKNNPEDYMAYNMIGMIYGQMGHNIESLAYIDTALNINPNYAYANLNKGVLATINKDSATAVKFLSKAISIDANYQDAYFNRGILYENFQLYKEAIQDFRVSLKLDKKDYAAYYHIGVCLIKIGNKEEGCENISKALLLSNAEDINKDYTRYCK
jgi:tetratricopeptide (TPR) repeat protein